MDSAELSGLKQLLDPQGWALLEMLPPYEQDRAMALSQGLRARGIAPDLVAAALTQSQLRAQARRKFGDFATSMLFTRTGLEQATRLVVGAHHARRYRDAGAALVADLGCGIGGDAMAMAALGLPVLAVEADEATAALASVNLRPFDQARVRHGDALEIGLAAEGVDAVFADPARRTAGGKRIFDPSGYTPPLDRLLALREQIPALGLKVAPGVPYTAIPGDAHAQWVSVDGEVVEAGLWFGPLAPEGPGRSALVLHGGDAQVLRESEAGADPGPAPNSPARIAEVRELGAFLYEPDGAVIRAGLVARMAEELGAGIVSDSIAYLTGPAEVETPFATGYRVLDHFPYSAKRLSGYLRGQRIGRVTIKKRGVDVDPARLRKQLGLRGENEATVVLTRLAGRHSVVVVEPL